MTKIKSNINKKSALNNLDLEQLIIVDSVGEKYVMILTDSLLNHISSNDVVFLKSLLTSSQKCFPSMLYTSSFASSSYSNVGTECLFILLNLKYRNHFLRSSDIVSKKDSLIKLVK